MILEVFSNLNDSMIKKYFTSKNVKGFKSATHKGCSHFKACPGKWESGNRGSLAFWCHSPL